MVEYGSAGPPISSATHRYPYNSDFFNPAVGKRDSHFVLAWQKYEYLDVQSHGYTIRTELFENSIPVGGPIAVSTDLGAQYPVSGCRF